MKFIIAYFCPLENNFQWLFAGIGLCLLAILIRKNIRLKREKEESKQEENRLREEIGYLRLSQALIENRMFRMYSRNYPKIKPLIEQKGDSKKCFNIEEYQELRYEIETFFEESIHKMRTACPILTNGDIVFLCLSKLKLPDAIIKICMGIAGADAIKQRRRRIKTKMRTHQCVELLKSLL